MSWTILTRRAYRSLFLLISVLAITGLIVTSSQAMQGMAPQKQPPPQQARPGPGIIDWGRALGPLLMPQPGPMIYPGEPLQPPENIDLLWPTDPGSGSVPPVEIPKLPPQQEPTPTVKPSTSQTLGLTGGNTPMVLGAPVTAIPPGTNLGQPPDDLLKNSPGNTQMPPGNQFAGPPAWKTPPGPGVTWPSPVGPDQDAIDAGKDLLKKQAEEEEAARLKAAEDAARKAEEDARKAKEAADDMIKKALALKQQAQQAIDDLQKKTQQAIDDMQKQAEQAMKDAAAEAAKQQQKQAEADAASKAQEQKAKDAKWAKENAEAWKEHQAKELKAQQDAQAQDQAKQQQQAQQAQQAQQQKQATQQFQQQQQQDLDGRDTKIRKALGGGP